MTTKKDTKKAPTKKAAKPNTSKAVNVKGTTEAKVNLAGFTDEKIEEAVQNLAATLSNPLRHTFSPIQLSETQHHVGMALWPQDARAGSVGTVDPGVLQRHMALRLVLDNSWIVPAKTVTDADENTTSLYDVQDVFKVADAIVQYINSGTATE